MLCSWESFQSKIYETSSKVWELWDTKLQAYKIKKTTVSLVTYLHSVSDSWKYAKCLNNYFTFKSLNSAEAINGIK